VILTIDVHEDESDTEALQREFGRQGIVEILLVRTRLLPPGVRRQLTVGVHRAGDDSFERFMRRFGDPQALAMADPPSPLGPGGSTPRTPPQRSGPGTVP
jgi:hypothetical protein